MYSDSNSKSNHNSNDNSIDNSNDNSDGNSAAYAYTVEHSNCLPRHSDRYCITDSYLFSKRHLDIYR